MVGSRHSDPIEYLVQSNIKHAQIPGKCRSHSDKQAIIFTQTLRLKCTWRQIFTHFILYQRC